MPSFQIMGTLLKATAVICSLTFPPLLVARELPAGQTGDVLVDLRRSVLAYTFLGQGGLRYFACELVVTNQARADITVSTTDVRLVADGNEYAAEFSPPSLNGYSLQVDEEPIPFRDLPQEQEFNLAPGAQQTSWLVYTNLPALSSVPRLILKLNLAGTPTEIDVNTHHARKLELSHRQIGPGMALGLVQIAGTLDTVNVGTLTGLTDELAGRGVSRIVISFAETVGPLSDELRGWLQQISEENGTARQYSQFPAVAPSIREIHVAGLPGHANGSSTQPSSRPFLHSSEASAVEWALEPVFRALPAGQVVEQVQRGDRLVRAAALATAADRLGHDQLPMIIELTASDDPVMQRSAFLALREFNHPLAVDTLVQYARGEDARGAIFAVECLAASRFGAAHEALATILQNEVAVPPVDLSRILSTYPREGWMKRLTAFATGEFPDDRLTREEVSDLRRDALLALGRIGHPQLVELLTDAIHSDDLPVRETAFSLLIAQTDERSHQLAVDAALTQLESRFPSHLILMLLERHPDPRAVPLLVNHLESTDQNRSNLIKTLARIGGADIDQTLAQKFSSLEPREQAAVLNELAELESDRVVPLAGEAIQSEDTLLFNAAITVLQVQDGPEAVEVLFQALNTTSTSRDVRALTRALGEIGTTAAMNALREARILAKDEEKLQQIVQMLTAMESRSPGQQSLRNAKQHAADENWAKAINDYNVALELDPELTSAYSGRGHSRLQLEQLEEASADFQAALERNPFDGMSVTGFGLVLVRQGEIEAGIRFVEEAAHRFPDDWVFSYNTACVYGRALESAFDEEPSADRDRRISEWQAEAMKKLQLSAEQGLPEFDYMKRDPDLKLLRELPEFQQLKAPELPDADS